MHEMHALATWNVVNWSSICWKTEQLGLGKRTGIKMYRYVTVVSALLL